ncbi:MAG: hydroxylamine oxidase [wastewater metagenome]|nr:hydroxylamine oxidase [Candidatus Loosdrechtia aerotolerans]
MKQALTYTFFLISLFLPVTSILAEEEQPITKPVPLSEETQVCILCHRNYTPGIVEDWLNSRHAKITPDAALEKPELERRISNDSVPEPLRSVAVGCYECHTRNPSAHEDNFEHFGFNINVIVSPNDCKTCHPVEVNEYSVSKKAYALENLQKNPLYHSFVETIMGLKEVKGTEITHLPASESSKAEACYACHGTRITVDGMKTISTETGDILVPNLLNWPNHGVGRINPDGSRGSCTPCHPRHSFSIEVARKPYTCSQCHLEPDVPAFEVYRESKHGNIFFSSGHEWNWDPVPWIIGKDFKVPTCATCHNSLLVTPAGKTVVQRTHDFGARLWVRIFGFVYSHPQPKDGRTYLIKNKDGLALPTAFDGEPASEYLIDENEQVRRKTEMKKICKNCHNTDWADKYYTKFETTLNETDKMVLSSTKLMFKAWKEGWADISNPFDEMIEHKWMTQWFFYANSIRFASAMSGPDYATFKNGWWELTTNLYELQDLVQSKESKE